jgi:hypothetical protein
VCREADRHIMYQHRIGPRLYLLILEGFYFGSSISRFLSFFAVSYMAVQVFFNFKFASLVKFYRFL